MLIPGSVPAVVCLLILIHGCNGLFENLHEKDNKMAVLRRWRRSEGREELIEGARQGLQKEFEENRSMTLKSTQHHLAGTRRYRTANHRTAAPSNEPPVIQFRRHAIFNQAASTTTTTTSATSSTTTSTTTAPPAPQTTPTPTSPPPPTTSPPTTTTTFPLVTSNPPPNTMSETMDSYFRPIDLNVPRDHLRPFQEFGKKLSRGHAPSTTINTNTLEVTTSRPRYLGASLRSRSDLEDELDEDMDVAVSKAYTEQNKPSRPHHVMLIKHGRPRPQHSRAATASTTTVRSHNDSAHESNDVIVVQVAPPRSENEGGTKKDDDVGESVPAVGRAKGNTTSSRDVYKGRAGERESVIQLIGVVKSENKNSSETSTSDSSIVDERTTGAPLVAKEKEKRVEKVVLPKFPVPGSRNGTGFVLLARRRGLVYGTKKNVTTTSKPKIITQELVKVLGEDKKDGVTTTAQTFVRGADDNLRGDASANYTKMPKTNVNRSVFSEKQGESPAEEQQVDNAITKHLRGNVTYKSQLLKNSRTPKTLDVAPPNTKQSEQLRATPLPDATTPKPTPKAPPKDAQGENPTSKILSTAVVTSISVLGEWTPILQAANTTDAAVENSTTTTNIMVIHEAVTQPSSTQGVVNITTSTPRPTRPSTATSTEATTPSSASYDDTTAPAIQTKESMQVSYSRNVHKHPVLNSTVPHLNANQTIDMLEMIRNITNSKQLREGLAVEESNRLSGNLTYGNQRTLPGVDLVRNTTFRGVKEETKVEQEVVEETVKQKSVELVNARDSKSNKFEGGKENKTEVEVQTEVPVGPTTTDPPTTDSAQAQEAVTSLEPEEASAGNFTSEEPALVVQTGAANTTGDLGVVVANVTSTTREAPASPTTTATVEGEEEATPTPRTMKPPRVLNMGERERTRVIYHTEEEEVSSRPGQEGTPDNDVATYILGTFGLIPVAIAVLLSVKYCISRRKKARPHVIQLLKGKKEIWESEKSPLTFVTTNEWEFPRSKLRLQTVLGQGNFGQVYKAEADDILGERATRLVAVKTVKDGGSSQEKEDLMRELGILKQIGAHSNVVTLLGCCTEKEPYYLILEYVMYGKLLSFLRDHRTRRQYYNFSEESAELTAKDLTSFAYCVARGMEYLTSKGIIHRDLAARNILVDHNKICKVADFGMSRSVTDPGEIYEQARPKGALPIRWMAPESLLYRIFTHKSDVWAFGILMWEIVTLGSTPYQNMSAREVIKQVRDGYRLERPDHCRPELYRVAARCWSHDPSKRPSFGELKVEFADLLEQGEPQTYVDLDSYIESISGSNSRPKPTTHVVNL